MYNKVLFIIVQLSMKSHFYHLQVNINYENVSFYKGVMTFLGWEIIAEMEQVIGYADKNGASLWFVETEEKKETNYDHFGVNHISIRVEEQANIDEFSEFMRLKGMKLLFDTPRHRSEFAAAEDETYYQVMFESPDKILFEIVYTGKKPVESV